MKVCRLAHSQKDLNTESICESKWVKYHPPEDSLIVILDNKKELFRI